MRQGEVASQGTWTGSATGGVKAPKALILSDPGKRFSNTAARLEALVIGHPMEDWLRFMAKLAHAQHVAATTLPPLAGLEQSVVEQAVAARMPPLAADGHRRDSAWRDGLAVILDHFDSGSMPTQVRMVIARLRACDAAAIEVLADNFLHSDVETVEAGPALYVAAALQVYFTAWPRACPH